jgi:hypothetical protein
MDGATFADPRPDHKEVPFRIGEMFYSRTDGRGMIIAGNQVFQRVSCHSWSNLIGAPHRIIRHPSTPRAVFRILWTTIQAGEPAVAYVCNKAADGRCYWVLATVLPFGTGYLSIRIKPSSPLLDVIKKLYAKLCLEEMNGCTVEASVEGLQRELLQLGFMDYKHFMRYALRSEFTQRIDATGGLSPLPERVISAIQDGFHRALEGQAILQSEFNWMQVLPTNLSLLASRLEPEGGPMSAVADLYKAGTLETLSRVGSFTSGEQSLCRQMSDQFERAVFMVTCAELQRELGKLLAGEDWTGSGLEPNTERQYVDEISRRYDAQAQASIDEASKLAKVIEQAGEKLRRSMLSLETIIMMGKVEGARFGPDAERIHSIIASLHDLNAKISGVMVSIVDLSAIFCSGLEELRSGFQT